MTSTRPNDTAFPLKNEPNCNDYEGLTKREYFAGLALQGILAACSHDPEVGGQPHEFAEYAVECAERLINALNQVSP